MEADPTSTFSARHRPLISTRQRTGAINGLAIVILGQALVSLIYITYFCHAFRISNWLVPIHLSLVTGLLTIGLVTPGFLLYNRSIRAWRFRRYLLVVIPACVSIAITLLYVTDFPTNLWMGFNANYKLLRLFLVDWWSGGDILSLSNWVWVGLGSVVVAIAGVYFALATAISGGLEKLLLPLQPGSLFATRRRATKSIIAIALLLLTFAAYVYVLAQRVAFSDMLSSDPLLSVPRGSTDTHDSAYVVTIKRLKSEEPEARARYAAAAQNFEKKNVIVIIVDSLRPDHTQVYGYDRPTTPFLAGLLAAGRLRKVEFATSTCAETNCGVLSTLFSKTLRHQVAEDFKLYDLLHDQGYKTYFILSGDHDWLGLKEAYGHEMDLYFDGLNSTRFKKADDRLIFEGLEKVPSHDSAPAFFYIHLMSVHLIGIKEDKYRIYQPATVKNDWRSLLRGEYDGTAVRNNYDNGVTQADATIKEVFSTLEQKGYLQNSLVVILSDHGEALGDRGNAEFGHARSLHQEFIRIPLLIYDDSATQYANLKFATQVDVAPTIVDRLGLRIPECWEGKSLLNPEIKSITLHQTSLRRPCYAVVYRTDAAIYKYSHCTSGDTEELYELKSDPKEQRNLMTTAEPALVQRLRDEVQRQKTN